MTTQSNAAFTDAIEELRRLAREPYEPSQELLRLRHRISSQRRRAHWSIIERVAKQANVDLQPIYEEAQRRNAVKRRYVTEAVERLEAKAFERARQDKEHFHRVRSEFIRTFRDLQQSTPQLKFHQPISSWGTATPGECNSIEGSGTLCSPPHPSSYEAGADFGPDPVGIWLFPIIKTDAGDCDDSRAGSTLQDLTYQMDPPSSSFAVTSVRVDLIGNGVVTSVFGDPGGLLEECDPLYVGHSVVDLTVFIAQRVNGEWHYWPLVSDRLFAGQGEYTKSLRLVLSGQTYPASIVIRNPDVGGGDLLCHLQIACSAQACGADARNGIDFRSSGLGMFVGGVSLLGDFV